jgi:arylsulfatase A-like enzyme
MIRREQWKLVHYPGYRPTLFNLREDPNEIHDLGSDPAFSEITRDLIERVLSGWSPAEVSEITERRMRAWPILAEWYRETQPESSDLWYPPDTHSPGSRRIT